MTGDRWAATAANVAQLLAESVDYVADQGAARIAEVDQVAATVRDLIRDCGINLTSRDELLAACVGADLVRVCAIHRHRIGVISHQQFLELQQEIRGAASVLARLVPPPARRWTLVYDARPFTLNNERGRHRLDIAAETAVWRGAYKFLALEQKIPHLQAITVEIQPVTRTGRSRQDVAACAPAAKAAIDGLVDARVIPDDNPDHLHGQTYLPPRVDPYQRADAALHLTVIEEPAHAS